MYIIPSVKVYAILLFHNILIELFIIFFLKFICFKWTQNKKEISCGAVWIFSSVK